VSIAAKVPMPGFVPTRPLVEYCIELNLRFVQPTEWAMRQTFTLEGTWQSKAYPCQRIDENLLYLM
jgi:hypothetical protein